MINPINMLLLRHIFPWLTRMLSAAVCFMTLTASCVTEDTPDNIGVGAGDPLPYFSVTLDNGETVSTGALRGKTVVIEFFYTGCRDCQEGLPAVNSLYEEYRDNPEVAIFAISRAETGESIEKYWKENGFTLPYSAQPDRSVYNLFATVGVPRTYIADKDGIITATFGDTDLPSLSDLKAAISR